MDDRRVVDYFVVAGLSDDPQPLEEFSNEAAIKPTYKQDPITDITVINKTLGEKVPRGYLCLDKTPGDNPANLNHGSIRCPEMYICYRRSRDKPPLTDVGVLYEGKERLMSGCEIVHTTFFGSPANINNSSSGRIYITYRRAAENAPSDMLAVVELCVILENKNESPPHSYCQIHKNLNKGLVGSDVFLCYKKAMTKTDILAYQPAILDRYPNEDFEDFPLPDSVPMFCLPMGASIECWSAKAQHPFPVFSTFILTGMGGKKVYGAAITFYEEYPESKLSDLQMRHLGLKNKHIREQYRIMKTVHANRSICLLSQWPFFDAFRKFLSYLYRISITGPHSVPIERHVSHFMYDVPYPSPQRPRILVQLSQDSLSLSMPEDSPLPHSGASFITMLKSLGAENCMTILLFVLHEYKILIHSLRPAVLTSVAEAVSNLIFPMQWQCPYIPLCPLGLSVVLNAPTPYIIGLDSRYFDLFDLPPDVVCIDLDTFRIWPGEEKKLITYKLLPKKPLKVLQETLHNLYERLIQEVPRHNQDEVTLDMAPIDFDFKRKQKEVVLELQIQEAFLRFMACLMKGYKQYLKPIENAPNIDTTNANSLFDMTGFLKSREKANHKFFQALMKTQLFNRFIEERSFVSEQDASLAFFDECTEKVDELKDEPKLIELDDSSKSERTIFIMPPEPVGLPEGKTYSYNGFPKLNPDLFMERKPRASSVKGRGKAAPLSPVARRTKQEIRTANKIAQQCLNQPALWAKCLLSHSYSLWFMMLPAYIKYSQSVLKALATAYDVLKNMQRHKLKPPDELCYRVMLQLCGRYNQPVMAVKVYSEMKHAGVQPNAITYGYYNKAVLEGHWPSSISKGRKLWRKVRNVIIGIAKFRKAIRRRSISVYSNSGSEFDQTSIDSFLEDGHTEGGKHEGIMKNDGDSAFKDGIKKGSSQLERAPSDRGYNSMTQEDAKNFREMIVEENEDKENQFKKDLKNAFRFSFKRKNKKKETEIQEENDEGELARSASGDHFRTRVGSIVRQRSVSGTSPGHDTLIKTNFGSIAGDLMISQRLVSGTLSKSLGPVGRSLVEQENSKIRKRHKSAGDHHQLKTRSQSLSANWPQFNLRVEEEGGKEKACMIEVSEVSGKSGLQGSLELTEIKDVAEEIKDSGVALDDDMNEGFVFQDGIELEEESADHEGRSHRCGDGSGQHVDEKGDHRGNRASDSAFMKVLTQDKNEVDGRGSALTSNGEVDADSDKKRFGTKSDSLKSATSSPLHSVPTPVTENDPLGLFVEDKQQQLKEEVKMRENTPKTSPQKTRESFVLTQPFQDEINRKGSQVGELSLGECNSSAADNENGSSNKLLSPVDKVQKMLFSKMERTSSFPENLGNQRKEEGHKGKVEDSRNDTVSLGRSSSSLYEQRTDAVRGADFRLFRAGSFRRHKDNFSGMLKIATGAFATKLTEIKLSMTPSKLGSNTSLTPSFDDMDSAEEDSYRDTMRKKYSRDYHKSDDKLDGSSINGVQESAPSHASFMERMDRQCQEEHLQRCEVEEPIETDEPEVEKAIEVDICSLHRCPKCRCLLYDEEIMAGWNADDSNLNTVCQFCNNKTVPHLLIYLKDHRGKKKSADSHDEADDDLIGLDGPSEHACMDSSYGKDASICPSSSSDHDFIIGEMDDNSSVKSFEDPWMRRSAIEETSNSPDNPSPERSEPMTMHEAARRGMHRRTASECFTAATDIYGSSVDSMESLTYRNLRSPLSISMDKTDPYTIEAKAQRTPEHKKAVFDRRNQAHEPISVPYLSPLVLRKNLETIIESEGNSTLSRDTFLDEHPILFWNLVWYFKRIGTTSHLPGFLLTAKSYNKDPELYKNAGYTAQNIHIRVKWDNLRLHQETGLPMYTAWNKGQSSTTVDALLTESQPFNRAVMYQIITHIHCSDVLTPIKMVMNGRRRLRTRRKRFRSMYREILFLSFVACGRENIDPDAFDREYRGAFVKLIGAELKRLQRDDKPRSMLVQSCRNAFGRLEV